MTPSPSPSHSPIKIKRYLLIVIALILWLGLIYLSHWWQGQQDIRQYENYFAQFDGREFATITLGDDTSDITVVHFVDDSCPCSRFSRPHIASLEKDYHQGIKHYYWPELPEKMKRALAPIALKATPAVAIWSASGTLSYFGPHSSGAFCGVGEDFVALILKQLLNKQTTTWLQHDVVGCYCPSLTNNN